MYNVNTPKVPAYIQDLIPPLVSEISDNPMRNNRNISVPSHRNQVVRHPLGYEKTPLKVT